MKLFCHFNYGIIEIANILGLTERRASNQVHEGLSDLAIYYGYKKSAQYYQRTRYKE